MALYNDMQELIGNTPLNFSIRRAASRIESENI